MTMVDVGLDEGDRPKIPGVWRRTMNSIDSSGWKRYPFLLAEEIFISFCNGRGYVEWEDSMFSARKRRRDAAKDNPADSTHRLYFDTMKEVELLTAIEVDVLIVQAPISSVNFRASTDFLPCLCSLIKPSPQICSLLSSISD